jgi:hypothetical protein
MLVSVVQGNTSAIISNRQTSWLIFLASRASQQREIGQRQRVIYTASISKRIVVSNKVESSSSYDYYSCCHPIVVNKSNKIASSIILLGTLASIRTCLCVYSVAGQVVVAIESGVGFELSSCSPVNDDYSSHKRLKDVGTRFVLFVWF